MGDRIDRDDLEELLGISEDEDSFEKFLNQKVEKVCREVPLSQRTVVSVPSSKENPVDAAGEDLLNDGSDETVVPADHVENFSAPNAANAQAAKQTLHNHPIVGSYITESVEALSYDDEMKEVYFSTYRILTEGITTPEQAKEQVEACITQFHKLERAVALSRIQQGSIKMAQEELLKLLNSHDRNLMLELDKKERSKNATRKAKEDKAKKVSTAKPKSTGKSKGQKTADMFKGMLYDKAATEQNLKTMNLLDESTQAYVDKIFA